MSGKLNWFGLLERAGIEPVIPYVEWPSNLLNFVEISISLKAIPIKIEDPEETRGLFMYKPLKDYKKKKYPIKKTMLILDSHNWKPIVIEPIIVKKGHDSVYKFINTSGELIYTPADEVSFRKLFSISSKAELYGMLKK